MHKTRLACHPHGTSSVFPRVHHASMAEEPASARRPASRWQQMQGQLHRKKDQYKHFLCTPVADFQEFSAEVICELIR